MSNPPRHLRAAGTGKGPLDASAALAAGLSAPFTGTVFDPADPVLAEVCTPHSPSVLRTDGLPVPMQREICWWLAECRDSGERVIDTTDWRRWTATALDVIAGQPPVCSFADLTLDEWMAAWARKFHDDHGRLPAAGRRQRAASTLRGLLPRLAIRYSGKPWWQHDVWCLRFDPRIPRREHEPRGESSVRWDDIEPRWLRDGFTFWMQLQLESGQLDLVISRAMARVRRPVQRVRGLPLAQPPGPDRGPGGTAAPDAGLPGVPAPVATGN